ncbi:hypothetical protein SAMN05216276_104648 [Streptosporangium subroseum]|uniref:Uncharacterized protein n=1 Tax=Streptosporangium subroseum TaxID=106412 RepID=A0A239MX82_9ACTN|nr:hypothetical protein [Streptosporangium subroseum]SNT46469.1 hypothetical protein SAMN05216276_104648 [Streptosporangium subroseum]
MQEKHGLIARTIVGIEQTMVADIDIGHGCPPIFGYLGPDFQVYRH